jgi:hypothetical protein
MNKMRDDETSVSYNAARKMWREGKHELIVDEDIVLKDWGIGKLRKG